MDQKRQLDITNPNDTAQISADCKQRYHLFLQHGVDLSKPLSAEDYSAYIQRFTGQKVSIGTTVPENAMFSDNTDVGIHRHPNYLASFTHAHEHFEIVYVQKGGCINYFENETLELKQGNILFIMPRVNHALSLFEDDSVVYNIIVKTSTFATTFLSMLKGRDMLSGFFLQALYNTARNLYVLFPTDVGVKIDSTVNDLYREYISDDRYRSRMLNAVISIFFIKLLKEHDTKMSYSRLLDDNTTTEAVKIVQCIYDNHIALTLKKLSDTFRYSERHIARIIKNYTGKTFMQLVEGVRLQKTTDLLLNSDISVAEIAAMVGYPSTNSLYRAFKHAHSTTPREFRRSRRM